MSGNWQAFEDGLRGSTAFAQLRSNPGPATGLPAEAAAWVQALLTEEVGRTTLVIVPRESIALSWQGASRLIGRDAVFFSPPSLTPYQSAPVPLSVTSREIVALDRLGRREVSTLITTPGALFRKLPKPQDFFGRTTIFEKGQRCELDELVERIATAGFERVDLVSEVGHYAVRGGIVDCWIAGNEYPVRFDFFGDEIESIRAFEPGDQRSRHDLDVVRLLPLNLFDAGLDRMEQLGRLLMDQLSDDVDDEEIGRLEGLISGRPFSNWQEFLPLLEDQAVSLSAWFDEDVLTVCFEPEEVLSELESHDQRLITDHKHRAAAGRVAPAPERLLHAVGQARPVVEGAAVMISNTVSPPGAADFETSATDQFHSQLQRFPAEVDGVLRRGERLVIAAPAAHRGRLETFCESYGLTVGAGGVELLEGELSRGFRMPSAGLALYSEEQLFRRVSPRRRRRGSSVFFSGLRDLKVGDFVVHEDHGIGQYVGLRRVGETSADDSHIPASVRSEKPLSTSSGFEVLEIQYSGERTLLLPPAGLDRIQRFLGFEGVAPRLDLLGGTSWAKKKERVKSGMRRMAGDLLRLYAERQLARAPKMPVDSDFQRQFDAAFDYEPTDDQLSAIASVTTDLEGERPMDRLLCGDVGFGKTEVAMRAAFKVVDAGYQVAVLAPTTILADQHLETFRKRFAGFPVEIDMVSRFRSTAEIAEIRSRVLSGGVDVLIGTHRLLSQDLEFKKLGLLIIDEEQRFGVAQKERLRKLKRDVHVLALTATPVPRTLQLSLGGVRDLSTIETPPRDRMSVETAIVVFNKDLVREAVEYELDRQGQVYYVYNRVDSIEEIADQLREICPRARVVIGHGQLDESELARRMHAFKGGDFDILLATTIIENGIDIPNVNTIFVHRADRFGLAQLYQLRGRVGRSRRLAYCYLLTPPHGRLTEVSRKRLTAIREFTELGAGFRVAARDLEIRGAGDLLGAEQSGHIGAVGLETYLKMLEETVRELRGEEIVDSVSTAIELPFEIVVPNDYIEEENLRLELYRQIASGEGTPDELLAELRDRYGEPPKSVFRLLEVSALKKEAEAFRVQSITGGRGVLKIRFRHDTAVDAGAVIRLVGERDELSFSPSGVLTWKGVPDERLVARAREALEALTPE